MKHIYLLILFTFFSFSSYSQNQPFILKWTLTSTTGLSVTIPTTGNGYNYSVDFGDGTVLTNQTGDATHTYNALGTYTITINGNFPRIYFFKLPGIYSQKKISVEQWGDIQWQSMKGAFYATSLTFNATDTPDLSQVTDMSEMFAYTGLFDSAINNWDVSNVTDMSYLFYNNYWFDQPLDNWDVSNVTNMKGMFRWTSFDQNINNWNVANVTDMSEMFINADFNQPINNWDVSNVTNMERMFFISDFNQPINNWNVSNVTNMKLMFANSQNSWDFFNQPLNNWDVSNVTNMEGMFGDNIEFDQPIDNWDVSNVTNMDFMFVGAKNFNQPLNNWNVSNVTSMSRMFGKTEYFNQPLNNWDVSNVIDMSDMFENALAFNQNINSWNVMNVTNMNGVFSGASAFNQPLNNWDVSNVIDMSDMFENALAFNQSLSNWNVTNVTNMNSMFSGANAFNQPLNNWDVSNVLDMGDMFQYATIFNQNLSNWDVSNVTKMYRMFTDASAFDQDLSQWNFNIGVSFYASGIRDFFSNSSLSVKNYDKLLTHFANLQLINSLQRANGIEYCNVAARNELVNNQGWNITGDSQSQNCNSITGMITYDENNNGCDPSDAGVSSFMVNANDGVNDIFSFSNNGNYELGSIGTNFIVSVINHPSYFSISPPTQQITFTTSNTEVADFCVNANQTIEDLNVTLLPMSQARPGFEADYQLVIENIGTQTLANATVTIDFDDSMQSFVSASVTPSSTTSNQLTFAITNLQPLTYQTVDITMQTFQPPTVNGDDVLSFTANVSPSANDYTPNDNTFIYDQIVVNSYDPNDKQVLQGEQVEIKNADEYLDYLIRFQNTGTASAINVRILDTLHPKLDYSTLKPINASHNYRIEITNDHKVEFIFEGINLPHESANEPASHGFVAYKIKPKSDVAVGDFITGDANIYLDFNAPIITNMVSTEIIDNIVETENPMANEIVVYPNPTQNVLNIETRNNQQIEAIKIYNLNGLELQTLKGNQKRLNIENLSSGVYFVKITTDKGVITKRVLKD